MQPLTPLGIARGLLAPPILRLTGLPLRQPAPVLALIALSTAAQLLSMIAEPGEPAPALDEIERHLARLEAAHMTSDATLRAAAFDLKTWVLAWRGLADGDVVRLEDARTRLVTMQARACDTWSGCNRSGMLALVSLALGGEVGGAERLAEAELAASEALSLAIELSEPAIIATCCALAGRTSLALGRARTDVRLLESARVRFDEAQRLSAGAWSDGACGLGDIAAEIGDVEAAIQELDAPLKRTAAPLTRDPPTLSLVRLTSRS
ncbi:MAG TPA: hypothetical protein PK264_12920 [Hyphomicrobiaceae bacterium]|nr:hypothetical protein [Hyphomicrobiaceae bacterium]